jgi:hypothetical protein
MGRRCAFALLLVAAVQAGGCATSTTQTPPSLITDTPGTDGTASSGYQLSKTELGYGCKKLAGTMQVRILQIRDYDSRNKASLAARGVQTITTPIFGGTTAEMDPDGQYRKDLAMLEAYNRRLAEKNCDTFDLAKELKGTDLFDMPRPVNSNKKE